MTFEELCQAARDNDQDKLANWKQQYGTLDLTKNAVCTFGSEEEGGFYEVQVRFTPASFLASEGNQTASDLFQNPTETAIGFILSGKLEMAEYYRERGASVSELAWAFALVKQHDLVKTYYEKHRAKAASITSGYEMSQCTSLATQYTDLRFQSTQARSIPKPTFDEVYATALAAVNDEESNHKLVSWSQQRVDVAARKLCSINIVKADGVTPCELQFRMTADTLLASEDHNQAAFSIAKLNGEGTGCAIGFAIKGQHAQVEGCRKRFRMSFNLIAKAYAMAGYHNKVEEYRERYNVKLDDIIAGYQIGDDFEKQLHYLALRQSLKKRKAVDTAVQDNPSASSTSDLHHPTARRKTSPIKHVNQGTLSTGRDRLFKPIPFGDRVPVGAAEKAENQLGAPGNGQ